MHTIQRSVGELLGDKPAPRVAPTDSISTVIRHMKEAGAPAALVLEGRRLVGLFTERDLLWRVAAAGLPDSTPVAEVMTAELLTLRSGDCVTWAINRLALRHLSNIPIVEGDEIVGVLGIRDVLSHLSEVLAELDGPEEDPADEQIDVGGGG